MLGLMRLSVLFYMFSFEIASCYLTIAADLVNSVVIVLLGSNFLI